ncbi:MAG: flavin reductase family protein [Treponema sp.]
MQIETNRSVITPLGVFIIGTYDENGVPNAMNAAWGTQNEMDEIVLCLGKHKTTDNLKRTNAFTVSFGTKNTVAISDYFGVESGKNINKIEKAGVHVHKSSKVNAPIIEEYPLTLECEVKSFNESTGFLIGKIVGEVADDSIITNGKIDLDKMKPIMYDSSTSSYRVVGEVVGTAFKDGLKLK